MIATKIIIVSIDVNFIAATTFYQLDHLTAATNTYGGMGTLQYLRRLKHSKMSNDCTCIFLFFLINSKKNVVCYLQNIHSDIVFTIFDFNSLIDKPIVPYEEFVVHLGLVR